MKHKILFADVDGPLCNYRSHLTYHGRGGLMTEWDTTACDFIHKLCEKHGVKIVISSSWRRAESMRKILQERLRQFDLYRYLFLPYSIEQSETRNLIGKRGHEIQDFLNSHADYIEDYRILDDDSDMLDDQMDKLILTHGHNGMTYENMLDLLKWVEPERNMTNAELNNDLKQIFGQK